VLPGYRDPDEGKLGGRSHGSCDRGHKWARYFGSTGEPKKSGPVGPLGVWRLVQKFVACPRGRGRPKDGQVLGKTLTVRLPVARGTTTGGAEIAVPVGVWTVRARPVTTEAPARNVVAKARMMVLRMAVCP